MNKARVFVLKEDAARRFFVSFYIIGLIGMLLPFTSSFFKALIPFSLLFNFSCLAYFHRHKLNLTAGMVFLFIALLGFVVEVIGVQTGRVFGGYWYGENLGVKLMDTPLLIGLNWLFMVYVTASVVEKWRLPMLWKVLFASCIMLGYDVIMESVAPDLGMWYWENGGIPMQNYITWFVLAFVFHLVIKIAKVKTANPLAFTILVGQFAFFLILSNVFSCS